MRTFTINVLPTPSENLRTRALLSRWVKESRWADEYLLDEGFRQEGEYWHLSFKSDRPRRSWFELKRFIETELPKPGSGRNKPPLIVVMEGEHGWDDYLLLYHFNGRTELDSVEEIPETA